MKRGHSLNKNKILGLLQQRVLLVILIIKYRKANNSIIRVTGITESEYYYFLYFAYLINSTNSFNF